MSKPQFLYLFFICGANALFFSFAFSLDMIYYFQEVEMDALQLVLVGTMLEFSVLVFEVPTGIVADLYGRKRSIIIGYILIGVGIALQGFFPLYWMILLCQLFWGVGHTFTSGAVEAWLSDELGETKANELMVLGVRPSQVMRIIGVALAALVMPFNMRIPLIIGGMGFFLTAIILILFMTEHGFKPADRSELTVLRQMWETLKDGLKETQRRPALKWILLLAVFLAIYTEGFDRMWIPFALDTYDFGLFESSHVFGAAQILSQIFSILVVTFLHRRLELSQQRTLVSVLTWLIGSLFFTLIFSFATPWLWVALLASILTGVIRSVIDPLHRTWVNRRLRPETRATVLSLSGQLDAVGQIIGGPAIGGISRQWGMRTGLGFSTLLLTPAFWLMMRKKVRREESVS
ncbi:MAG: MFS transporter [Anaerolineae bacterium]|jgi:DHA3 family tetracycline resistance protein-like MFS transporter|nr:MFS transporter [Anaerolineae bacterium]